VCLCRCVCVFFLLFFGCILLRNKLYIYYYRRSSVVSLCVCLSVDHVREPCKTAKQNKMPFGSVTQMGPRNHVLDGSPNLPLGRGNVVRPTEKHCESLLQCTQQKNNNSISATAAADCIPPDWQVSH